MGDNSIFSVFSNIWSSVRLKIPPQFQASWWQRLFTLEPAKKNDSFSFYLSIAVLLVFLYLIAAYASVRQCVIIICRCPQNIIEIYLSRKNFIEICCQKCQKCNTICVTTFFYWISRVCHKKIYTPAS